MNQADWTPSPVTERESAVLRRRTRWGPLNVIGAGLGSVGAIVSLPLMIDGIVRGSGWGQVVGCGVAFLLFLAIPIWLAMRDNALVRDAAAPDRAKRDEFGAGSGWLVDLRILQGAAVTGRDRGMLWFDNGRLCFSGDRTSFALAPGQVAGRCRCGSSALSTRIGSRLPLDHRTDAGQVSLEFEFGHEPSRFERNAANDAIDRWARESRAEDGQFPPTRLGPGAAHPAALAARALFSWGWVAAAVSIEWSLLQGGDFSSIFAFTLGAILGGWMLGCRPVGSLRALRDRLRVEREGP